MKKVMTTAEYAKLRGVSQQSVRKSLKEGWSLPGLIEILPKSGKYWFIRVSVNDVEKKVQNTSKKDSQ